MSDDDLPPRARKLVLALTEGSLAPSAREAAEAELLALPGGRATLERQMSVATLLRHGPPAPPALRAHIEAQLQERRPKTRIRAVPRLAMSGALGLVALVALLVGLSIDGGGGPSVAEASELAIRPATGPTQKQFEGVTFPDWTAEFGWRPIGARRDSIDGRDAETVFYTHEGHRIGYTVVSGDTLEVPETARRQTVNGVDVFVYKDGGRDVAVFERGGQTCILSGRVLRQSTLVGLAAWTGTGSVELPGFEKPHHH